jgi:hypothetical protein
MDTSIKLSDFSKMSEQEKKSSTESLVRSAIFPTNKERQDWVKRVFAEVQSYENKYRMPSDEMLKILKSGKNLNIPELCSWLMVLKTQEQIKRKYNYN